MGMGDGGWGPTSSLAAKRWTVPKPRRNFTSCQSLAASPNATWTKGGQALPAPSATKRGKEKTTGLKGSKAGLDDLEGFGPLRMMGTWRAKVNDKVDDLVASASTSVLRRWKRLKSAEPLNLD